MKKVYEAAMWTHQIAEEQLSLAEGNDETLLSFLTEGATYAFLTPQEFAMLLKKAEQAYKTVQLFDQWGNAMYNRINF